MGAEEDGVFGDQPKPEEGPSEDEQGEAGFEKIDHDGQFVCHRAAGYSAALMADASCWTGCKTDTVAMIYGRVCQYRFRCFWEILKL